MELLLITSYYPYNYGDAVFIKPEMPFLAKAFDMIHIIYTSHDAHQYTMLDVPSNVTIVPPEIRKKRGGLKLVFTSVFRPFFIMGLFLEELFYLIKRKKCNKKTVRKAIDFLLDANVEGEYIKKYLAQNQGIKIVYSFWYVNETMAALICKKTFQPQLKCITRTHGYDLYEFRQDQNYQPYKKWMDKHIDRVYFVCQAARTYYLELFAGKDRKKYILSRLGINNPYTFFYHDNKKNSVEGLAIISCSNMIAIKRIPLIIEALSKIDAICIKWVHIGDGDQRKSICDFADELLGKKKNIDYHFTGYIDNDSIKHFYYENYFDFFVSTTETEGGTPVSMMEAISFGIPVIASNVGGVPDIVNRETGVLLDPDNCVEELVNALHFFYNMNVLERQSLRKSCRKYWEENYMAGKQYTGFIHDIKSLCEI
jgi:glycosyltransferase involved in cell wall biosynthesis